MCLSFQFIRQSRVNFAHYQVILRKRSQEKLASVPYKPYITNALKQEANLLIMYYLKKPQSLKVVRATESLEKAKSLRKMLLDKDIVTIITKNNKVVSLHHNTLKE